MNNGVIKPFRPFKKYKSKPSRYTKQYNEWRRSVYERDNHTCQVCERVNIRCIAHHILSYKKYPLLRFDIKNGITLCRKCHKKFHDRFGKSSFPKITAVYEIKNKEKYI